jgi:hypothetical protein
VINRKLFCDLREFGGKVTNSRYPKAKLWYDCETGATLLETAPLTCKSAEGSVVIYREAVKDLLLAIEAEMGGCDVTGHGQDAGRCDVCKYSDMCNLRVVFNQWVGLI